jgi:hypothetical protein
MGSNQKGDMTQMKWLRMLRRPLGGELVVQTNGHASVHLSLAKDCTQN